METLTGISTGAIVRLACAQVPGAVPLTEAASTDTRIIILWKWAQLRQPVETEGRRVEVQTSSSGRTRNVRVST